MAVVCLLAAYAWRHAGTWLVSVQPVVRSNAIVVLAGTRMERPLEAAELYRAGWAPIIVLTSETRERAERTLEKRGLHYPSEPEIVRDLYLKMGIPAEAIVLVPGEHDSTADEARTLYRLASAGLWDRVIVVTSKLHTRRAGFAIRRALKGLNVEVRVHASRYDPADPDRWWRQRSDMRFVLFEWQKFFFYALNVE